MLQFNLFIQIILFHNNTVATSSFSKPFDEVRCRFTILTFIEISPTFEKRDRHDTTINCSCKLSLKAESNNKNEYKF